MLTTGARIGEALALRHSANGDGKPLLDLTAKTWEVNAAVVRVPKRGSSCSRVRKPPPVGG
jgi:hypothetical protein